jgi:hypothetical protein
MNTIRTTFSLDVADRIKAGRTITEALKDVLGGIRDGSAPRTVDVLNDLDDMGIWNPLPGGPRG